MIGSDKSKKILTENGVIFFQRILPKSKINRIVKEFLLDKNVVKLFFRNFIILLLVLLILQPAETSSRDMSQASRENGLKHLSGIDSVSHRGITKRLNSIHPDAMDQVLAIVRNYYKKRLKFRGCFPRGMTVFDITEFSASNKHYRWAAKRRKRRGLRFLFVMNTYSGAPNKIVDAWGSTNDNTVFEEAIKGSRKGDVLVFDRGFNNFSLFSMLNKKKITFITRWRKNYIWKKLYDRKISSKEKLSDGWKIVSDEVGVLGGKTTKEKLIVRRITSRSPTGRKSFQIFTNDRNISATKATRIYVARWPIEVYFRTIKSSLGVIHFPTRDPHGVHNWMVLIAISILLILIMTLPEKQKKEISLMYRESPFKSRYRQARSLLREWIAMEYQLSKS